MLGKGCNLDDFQQAWVDILSYEVSPKVRHFLWRLCTNSLPTRSLLKYRHFIDDDSFPWGCGEVETARHAIFDCPRFAEVWSECGCDVLRAGNTDLNMCELVASW